MGIWAPGREREYIKDGDLMFDPIRDLHSGQLGSGNVGHQRETENFHIRHPTCTLVLRLH